MRMAPHSSFRRDGGFDVGRIMVAVFRIRPGPGSTGGGVRRRGGRGAEGPGPPGRGRPENVGGEGRGVLRGIASDQEGARTVYKVGKKRQGVRGGGLFARVPRGLHVNRRGRNHGPVDDEEEEGEFGARDPPKTVWHSNS